MKNSLIKIISVILFQAVSFVFAQVESNITHTNPNIDTNYIVDQTDKLILRSYIITKSSSFSLIDNENKNRLNYNSNSNSNLGVGFNYKWLGLGIAFDVFKNRNLEKFGKTSQFDIQLNIYTRKFIVDGHFQRYKGFYIANPQKYFADFDSLHYPIRPDISTFTIGGNIILVDKFKKYSYRSAFVQNEMQKKSSGSFVYGGFTNIFIINTNNKSLIPAEADSFFNNKLNLTRSETYNLGTMVGYTHTFVYEKLYFFQISLMLGLGFQQRIYKNIDAGYNQSIFTAGGKANGRISFGYNGERFFIGISGVNDLITAESRDRSIKIETGLANARLFFGYKFDVKQKSH